MAASLPCSLHGASPAPAPRRRGAPALGSGLLQARVTGAWGQNPPHVPVSSSTVGLRALEKGIPGTTGWRGASGLLDQQQVVRSVSRDVLT